MNIFEIQGTLVLVGFIAALVVKVFALVTALSFREEAYAAAGKLTKVTWCAILGLGVAAQLLIPNPLGILNVVALVATLVFIADARPALIEVTRH